jgi:hypothetical protein
MKTAPKLIQGVRLKGPARRCPSADQIPDHGTFHGVFPNVPKQHRQQVGRRGTFANARPGQSKSLVEVPDDLASIVGGVPLTHGFPPVTPYFQSRITNAICCSILPLLSSSDIVTPLTARSRRNAKSGISSAFLPLALKITSCDLTPAIAAGLPSSTAITCVRL